jgi:hypothetical protein
MFRLRAANFKITGLADLISQSREVPSQLAVATQRPSGGLTSTTKLHRGAHSAPPTRRTGCFSSNAHSCIHVPCEHIHSGGPSVFHHAIWLRNLLEERNFTWRMCQALTSDTTGRSPEVYRQAVKTRLSPLSSSLLADGRCRRIHREVPPCLHFPALNLGR